VLAFLVARFPAPLAYATWGAFALAVAGLAWWKIRNSDRCGQAVAFVLAYLLVSPRPMAYGWVLAGGALVACAWAAVPGALPRAALVALILLQGVLWAAGYPLAGGLAEALPWAVALGLGLLAVWAAPKGRMQAEPPPARVS
jgi:hypothetical protein